MKKLYRSKTNNKIAGVCGGLGQYFGIDPSFIRLAFVLIGIFTAILPVFIVYFVFILIVPLEQARVTKRNYRKLYRSKKNKIIAGICGGIAEFFRVDATIIRLIFVFFALITAILPMCITYLVAYIIIPENPSKFIEIEIEKD